MTAEKIKSLPMGKNKLYTLMNKNCRRKKKVWSLECTQSKRYIISGMNLNTDPGQIDPICTEDISVAERYTQLII